ncbi:MAG TPA: hypothetical protein PKA63_03485 [Oligoflexia bacterium]|nr:hypothetical protein [Oligoflexia bacterium]HMP47716.1 hypothetical protein [Oligoflexia bacterium]
MSIDYLEDLERIIDSGKDMYVCPGAQSADWELSNDLESLRKKAQRTANALKFQVHIYRVINKGDTLGEDSFLVVRKILDSTARGEPRFQWAIVDTKEAAEMLRDVSQGPTPYFGATVEETFHPGK